MRTTAHERRTYEIMTEMQLKKLIVQGVTREQKLAKLELAKRNRENTNPKLEQT